LRLTIEETPITYTTMTDTHDLTEEDPGSGEAHRHTHLPSDRARQGRTTAAPGRIEKQQSQIFEFNLNYI
jgi:hypothetical protein